MTAVPDEVIQRIRATAAKKTAAERFAPTDGDEYDAYEMGSDDGEILFARELLKLLPGDGGPKQIRYLDEAAQQAALRQPPGSTP